MKDAYSSFNEIPMGRPDSEIVQFVNYDLYDTYFPNVYALDGTDVKLQGPLRVIELRRRNQIRFVKVEFYQWDEIPTGVVPRKYMTSYAWQGIHALHLLENPTVLDLDPFDPPADDDLGGGTMGKELDAKHLRFLTLTGEQDAHLDVM